MSRNADVVATMRADVIRIVREETGLHERLALPIAERIVSGLRARWGGEDVRIPAETAAERRASIRAAAELGFSVSEIEDMGYSRATVYRALSRD